MYTSGKNSEQISDWIYTQCGRMQIDFTECGFVLADESRQDSHVSWQSLQFENDQMAKLGIPTDTWYPLQQSLVSRGFTRFGISYSREGGRDTGHPLTSSGNSHMNAIKFLNYLSTRAQFDWSDPPFALCIQGDDSMLLCSKTFLKLISEQSLIDHSNYLGFKVKFVTITTDFRDVDYCSRMFWPTAEHPLGYILCPKISKVLCKIGYSKTRVEDIYVHNRGVALGLYNSVSNVPFLREWCIKLLELTSNCEASAIFNKYSINSSITHSYTHQTWDILFHRYKLTQNDLSIWEFNLQTVRSLPWKISFPGDLEQLNLSGL